MDGNVVIDVDDEESRDAEVSSGSSGRNLLKFVKKNSKFLCTTKFQRIKMTAAVLQSRPKYCLYRLIAKSANSGTPPRPRRPSMEIVIPPKPKRIKMTKAQLQALCLEFFNEAPEQKLNSAPKCSAKVVQFLLANRPFADFDSLVRLSEGDFFQERCQIFVFLCRKWFVC